MSARKRIAPTYIILNSENLLEKIQIANFLSSLENVGLGKTACSAVIIKIVHILKLMTAIREINVLTTMMLVKRKKKKKVINLKKIKIKKLINCIETKEENSLAPIPENSQNQSQTEENPKICIE